MARLANMKEDMFGGKTENLVHLYLDDGGHQVPDEDGVLGVWEG